MDRLGGLMHPGLTLNGETAGQLPFAPTKDNKVW
jgi:hypothetical protein